MDLNDLKTKIIDWVLGISALMVLLYVGDCSTKYIKSIYKEHFHSNENVYTLYRTSVLDEIARIHVASFDSTDLGERYNFDSCIYTKELYEKQEGVKTRFWCEKGRYKK